MIPTSQDIDDKAGLIFYMLNILKKSNLEPHTCEVLSIEHDVPDPEALIRKYRVVKPTSCSSTTEQLNGHNIPMQFYLHFINNGRQWSLY